LKRYLFRAVVCMGVLALWGGSSSYAQAGLVTTSAGFGPPVEVVDFSQFNGGFTFGPGPQQIGGLVGEDIVWTSTNASNNGGAVIGNGSYGLGDNGFWDGAFSYTGLNDSSVSDSVTDTMTYQFNTAPVAAVGGFINYAPNFGDVTITALDSNGNVLESYDLSLLAPINTPGQTDGGAFRGIMRPTADIAALTVSDGFVVLTDLTFSHNATAVPEPASLTLLCLGTLSVCGYYWRRNKQCPCQ
jgi:PEP-CTERM motif